MTDALVCRICGALIDDPFLHTRWHEDTDTEGAP